MDLIFFGQNAYRPAPAGPGGVFRLVLSDGAVCTGTAETLTAEWQARGLAPRCDFLDAHATVEYRQKNGFPAPEYFVSACLAGECCRYDGKSSENAALRALVEKGAALPVCPECMGGLPCPRTPCELRHGRVVGRDGGDYSGAFEAGARRYLEWLRLFPIRAAILKERSPSCGVHRVYDGSFQSRLIPGRGLFAALLAAKALTLYTEETDLN